MTVPDRLRAPALAPVWRAVHERLSSGRAVTRVRVGPLDAEQRTALADLLGLDRLPGEFHHLRLGHLDAVLAEVTGLDTGAVAAALLGPLDDRAGRRARAAAERAELWRWLAGHEVVRGQPALAEWAAQLGRAGLQAGSVPVTRALLERALLVLGRLPAQGLPLPAFATEVLADPHALDDGTRLASLVQRALAVIFAVEAPQGAEQRRALWERVGVAEDDLSTVVVAAGLRPAGPGLASRILRACVEVGEAAALTLAQLRASPPFAPDGVGADVWVVENPSLLALAVRRFGRRCPPMVCTAGWPNGAGVLLLRRLAATGARLHYHGDLDGEGVRIAAYVLAKTGATPWRMSAADYLAEVTRAGGATGATAPAPPTGRVTDAPWDPDLAAAMRTHDVAVPEERVAAALLADLSRILD
ncbi:MAG TPA: TIGR02679 family protein [Mycobacteriales bacterium]|nr:TIGR02679 family protein [Mycobacteriales bacterium]